MQIQTILKKIQFTAGGYVALLSFVFTLFSVSAVYSQSRYIKITNSQSGKEIIFKEGKGIRITTVDKGKLSGPFFIIDSETILVRGFKVSLRDIVKIKFHPLALKIAVAAILIPAALLSGFAVMSEVLGGGGLFALSGFTGLTFAPVYALLSVGFYYLAFHPPNILKGFRVDKGWHYDIII